MLSKLLNDLMSALEWEIQCIYSFMRRLLQSIWVKGKTVDIYLGGNQGVSILGKYKSWQLLVHLKNCSYRRYRLSCIFISILDRFQKYLPQPFALPCCLSAWPSFEVGGEEAAAESVGRPLSRKLRFPSDLILSPVKQTKSSDQWRGHFSGMADI